MFRAVFQSHVPVIHRAGRVILFDIA